MKAKRKGQMANGKRTLIAVLLTSVFWLLAPALHAQTTTVTGTIKDLTQAAVTSGQVTFDLQPGIDTTISASARITPQTVTCGLATNGLVTNLGNLNVTTTVGTTSPGTSVTVTSATGFAVNQPIAIPGAGAAGALYVGTVSNIAGAVFTLTPATQTSVNAGTQIYAACQVTQNTALTPSGTYYKVSIWPGFVKTSTFNWYAVGSLQDISTIVPTPATLPAYTFVDMASAQTITGEKTFGTVQAKKLNGVYYASQYAGADACAKIQAAITAGGTGASVFADFSGAQTCAGQVTISADDVTLSFRSSSIYTFTPSGLYGIGSTGARTRIYANGATLEATKAWADAGHYNVIECLKNDGCHIEDANVHLTMTGSVPTVTQALVHGISVQNTITSSDDATTDIAPTNATIRNNRVWVRGHVTDGTAMTKQAGIFFGTLGTTLRANGAVIEGNFFDDSYGRNVYVYHADNVVVRGNITPNLGATLTDANDSGAKHIRIIGSKNVVVDGNIVGMTGSSGFSRALTVEGDMQSENVVFNNNAVFLSGAYNDIQTDGSAAMFMDWCKECTFSNNVLRYTGTTATKIDGIQIRDVDGPSINALIEGNKVSGFPQRQFRVIGTTHDDMVVEGNVWGTGGGAFYTIPALTRLRYNHNIEGTTATPMTRFEPPHFVPGWLAGDTAAKTSGRVARIFETLENPAELQVGLDIQTSFVATSANAQAARSLQVINHIDGTTTTAPSGTHTGIDILSQVDTGGTNLTIPTMKGLTIGASVMDAGDTLTDWTGIEIAAPIGSGTVTNKRPFNVLAGAGFVKFSDGMILGATGSTMTAHYSNQASLNFDFSGAGITEHDLTITVTGAAVADVCVLGLPAALQVSGLMFSCFVSATNTVTVRGMDVTSSGANPAAATVRADVWVH